MIIGILVCTIGLIPIVLAFGVRKLYKGSDLSLGLLIYMILISIWQADIGILYFKDILDERTIFWFFRLFRLAPTFAIPVTFYVAFTIIKKHTTSFKEGTFINKLLAIVFTRRTFMVLTVWSSIVYVINWTPLGLKGLKVVPIYHSTFSFYFPQYGSLSWLYMFHMSSFIVFLFFIYFLSKNILNQYINKFLGTFSICSLLLFITGFINFYPGTGAISSSIGVIIFSIIIMLAFIKLNTMITINYNNLIERQKKLDYTGNLAGSLIHEVKNTIQVIKGFSKILDNSISTDLEKGSLDLIKSAAQQLEDLANSYNDYIKFSKMEFRVEDINQIIELSIKFSNEIVKDKEVEIEFNKKFKTLKAFVNKTYLQQVFINLIKNSSEAIPLDRDMRKITIDTDFIGESIVINFFDTGTGIPIENWESIFDPFISFKNEGMGLGLPFVKKVIFEHKGNIQVITSTPMGTQFQITIPQFEFSDFHD
jgi:signal transduction histidine kinase